MPTAMPCGRCRSHAMAAWHSRAGRTTPCVFGAAPTEQRIRVGDPMLRALLGVVIGMFVGLMCGAMLAFGIHHFDYDAMRVQNSGWTSYPTVSGPLRIYSTPPQPLESLL